MLKTNKDRIQRKLVQEGYKLGCYDNGLEKLNYANLMKVINRIPEGATDVPVFINRKPHIVEIFDVDDEYDFKLLSKAQYQSQYGHQYDDKFGW